MRTEDYAHLRVTLEADGRRVVLELDHGKANEMGSEQLREIERLVAAIRADGRIGAMITFSRRTSSRGTPIFVAGANVTERVGWTHDQIKTHVAWQRQVLTGLRQAPVFHVCVPSGVALGWGTEFMLTADYRIAAPSAVFGLPETGLGIVPGAGGTSDLWAHIGVAQTLRLGMTGERVDAAEAYRIGLVQELADDLDAGLARARALCDLVARRSPTAVAAFKQGVLQAVGAAQQWRPEIERRVYDHCVDSGDAAVGREHFQALVKGGQAPYGPRVEIAERK